MVKVPHLVQYQGSKRLLAPHIIKYINNDKKRLIEPFSGMAAITIASAFNGYTGSFHLNDLNEPIIKLLKKAIEDPEILASKYKGIWNAQFTFEEHTNHFYEIREEFNNGEDHPEYMLYLLARCVKGAVRYGNEGNFNQSPDKRRHGTKPETILKNALAISKLLKDRTVFTSKDYKEILANATIDDLIYMDPPYQGVSNTKNQRYLSGVNFDEFVGELHKLDQRGIDYIVSYDGTCGEKTYGNALPDTLNCQKIILNAGVSSQSVLLGKKEITQESLYISNGLLSIKRFEPVQLCNVEA